MTTAIDSSVVLDVLSGDPEHGLRSLSALESARREGRLVVGPVVWAEVRACYRESDLMEDTLHDAGIEFDPIDREGADLAGRLWRRYRDRGGRRTRMLADFLVAAHAITRADRLLTRDRGFGHDYFDGLVVLHPTD